MSDARSPLPFLVTLLAIALFALMDALMKDASIAVGAFSAVFWRSCVGFALVLPLWLHLGARWPSRSVAILHAKRGIVAAGMAMSFFYALVRLPMAEAIALSFIAPLIALALAALLLGERIERQAIGASLMGIAGVCVIAFARSTAPAAHAEAGLGIVAVLLSACLYAWNLILQRQQALVAGPLEVAVFQSGIMSLTLLAGLPWLLVMPGPGAWLSISAGALLGIVSLMLMSWAYARAETQALVPLEYSAFLWAALAGWLFFAERVTMPTVLGAALIVAGCWIATPRRHIEQTAL